ncbi:MAG: ATP-binding cassette domain-containing protein, partial [Rectinema sp.]|nr:ATP-binding cassette domain-containing protein [Rectinema sp.]
MGVTDFILERIRQAKGLARDPRKSRNLGIAAAVGIIVFPLLPFIDNYWIDIGFYFGIYALLGLSLNIVLGEVGLFDLGHTGFYAIGAYTTAILNTRFHIPILVLLPVSAVIAGLFAWLVTSPVIHLKGDYLCIVTIGIGEIVRLTMINNPFGLTGGPNGINGIDNPVLLFPILSSRQFYYFIWIIIGLVTFGLLRLQRSRVGRAWNFIREDEIAAEALGIDVRHYKLGAFILGAALAGLAGNIYASKQMSVSPESFTFMESSLLFCIVLLGGLGSIPGTMLGALAITIFPEIFRPFAKYRLMFFGLALLLMMIFKPAGILPRTRDSVETLRKAISKRRQRRIASEHITASAVCPEPAESRAPAKTSMGHSHAGASSLLRVKDAHLSFGGVMAVAGIDVEVEKGKITALIGPNGAGKTTLFNLITGIYRPEKGSICLDGEEISGLLPHIIVKKGIARTFQNIRIFPNLTCLENVLCGQHCHGRAGFVASIFHLPWQQDEESAMFDCAQQCLERVGLG